MKFSNILISLLSINLFACQLESDSPRQITEKYWQSLKNGDSETARQLVSTTTQRDFDDELARPDEEKLPLDDISIGAEQMTVSTIITHDGQHTAFDTVLIQQDGKWKVDASRTAIPSAPLPDAKADDQAPDELQENLDAMTETLEEGADLLNELMQKGSKEMSESLRKGMDKMNEAMREAMENMKKRREQQQPEQPPADQKSNGEGLL